jgi:putative ABC transport system permease protein
MIKNYFKTAFRNLWRNKNFTFINVAGLAVGIAVCLVIFLIIRFELSFDDFHPKKNNIYRILSERHGDNGVNHTSGVPYPVPTTLHNDFPSLVSSAVYGDRDNQVLIPDEKNGQAIKKFKEEGGVFFVEPAFFKIFDFPLLAGEYNSLKEPNTAVLTKTTAERYFGDWRLAIGKTFKRNNKDLFKITGVIADPPSNTDLQLKIVASYATLKDFTGSTDWISIASNHGCYILLPEETSAAAMNRQLASFYKKYDKSEEPASQRGNLKVQTLAGVHYDADSGNFIDRTVSKSMIKTMWLIAAFILLIA